MKKQDLLLVDKKNGICTITINHPQKLNILSRELFIRLVDIIESVGDDGQTRVVVLRGAGEKAFSAGYDISRLTLSEDPDNQDALEDIILAIESCPVPVIAMIYGYCVAAGCGLALACDLRLAADSARLGITAAKIGVLYPPSATLRLIKLIGVAAAKELLYTGKLIDAIRAHEIGLVHQVVPRDRLVGVTYDLAQEIADNAPLSVRGNKIIISRLLDYHSLSSQVREEFLALQKQITRSHDMEEGKKAFSEKRKPLFRGE